MNPPLTVLVIGDGAWGTALALLLHRHRARVRVWGPFPEYLDEVRRRRENIKFLPGIPLPPDVEWIADPPAAAAGADIVVLASPSPYFVDVLRRFAPHLPPGARVVSVTKGLDRTTHRRMSELASERLAGRPVAALSGPSFAEEVARGMPTAVVVACRDRTTTAALQAAFSGATFRVYTSDDPIGVELGGALKNVVALAAGAVDGLNLGYNTKAALITRGLAEMTRLGAALGAHPATFAGLSGVGDLVLTCTGSLSRNREVGERLGRGEALADILRGMVHVAEGVVNCESACALAADAGVTLPIAEAVRAVLRGERTPGDAVRHLMLRDPRGERD